jgi:hypothetical protein
VDEEVELDDPFAAVHDRIYARLGELDLRLDTAALEKLTRLAARHDAAFRTWRDNPGVQRNLRIDERLGEASRRMFRGKVAEALAAVDEVLSYVTKISQGNAELARALRDAAVPYLKSARQSRGETYSPRHNVAVRPDSRGPRSTA